jgi:iron complex transport system substrate-binding protein
MQGEKMKFFSPLTFLILLLIGVTACVAPTAPVAPANTPVTSTVSTATYPLTIENCGRTLTFAGPPQRIIATFQSVAETLVALGQTDKLVGVYFGAPFDLPPELADDYAKIPALGEGMFPSKEAVVSTRPDLVVASEYNYDFDPAIGSATVEDLTQAGAQIYGFSCSADEFQTLDDVYARILELGQILGVEAAAQGLIAEQQQRIAAVHARVADQSPVATMVYYAGEGPVQVFGSGFANQIIELAGGRNVFKAEAAVYADISNEAVAAANPEIFIVADFGPKAAAYQAEKPLDFLLSTFSTTTAATAKRGAAVSAPGFSPGVRMATTVEQLAQALHPTSFAAPLPAAATDQATNPQECLTTFDPTLDYFPVKSTVTDAKLWQIEYAKHYKVIRTSIDSLTGSDGKATPNSQTYVLLQCGAPAPDLVGDLAGATIIEVPVKNAVATYYEDVTALFELGLADKVVAIPDPVFIAEKGKLLPTPIMAGVAAGTVQVYGEQVSAEVFVALQPGVVFAYSVYGYDDHSTLTTAGVPAVGVLNAAEATPLGDAEWIKFFAAFFNAEADANALFDEVAQNYNDLAAQAAAQSNKPNVMMVSPYSADYFEAHQNSWGARLIEDAGGLNLLAADGSTAPQGISGEVVIQAGYAAQVWLTEFSAFDLAEKRESIANVPFAEFPAVQNKHIWNIGKTDADKNHFYGFWSTRPDLLLQDLVSLLHPTLLPDHQLLVLEPPVND